MATLTQDVSALLAHTPGLTDRELTDRLRDRSARQQPTNAACRELVGAGSFERRKRDDGLIGNYPKRTAMARVLPAPELNQGSTMDALDNTEQQGAFSESHGQHGPPFG